MEFSLRFLILSVVLGVLAGNANGSPYGSDYSDEDSELSRRDAQVQDSQQNQVGSSDKDKLSEFPEFPSDDYDKLDEQKPSVQEPQIEDLVPPPHLDQYGQGRDETVDQTPVETSNYKKGYIPREETRNEVEVEREGKPWHKKVGHFFKKHYGNVRDFFRGKRDDYTY